MRWFLVPLVTAMAMAGCMEKLPTARWAKIVDAAGVNACDSPVAKSVILNEFSVDHQRFFANVTMNFDAGLVRFQLADPFDHVAYEKQFSAPGSDSALIEEPTMGIWEFRVECPTHVRVDLEWHLVVEALTKT